MDESLVFSPPDVALLDEAMRMAEDQMALAAETAASSAVPSAAAAALAPQHQSKAPQKLQQPAPQARQMPQPQAQLLLSSSSWGLPANFVAQYKRKGVEKLYSWQCDCLRRPGVLGGKNLVYCAPTSGGKTLVAEILMIRRMLAEPTQKALFVLPFVSMVSEKSAHFEFICDNRVAMHGNESGHRRLRVKCFTSKEDGERDFGKAQIGVCTIEKANIIVNRMMEQNELSQIGCVVLDEMHMLGDEYRGYMLELLATKLHAARLSSERALAASPDGLTHELTGGLSAAAAAAAAAAVPVFAAVGTAASAAAASAAEVQASGSGGTGGPAGNVARRMRHPQIIGLSATLPNVGELAEWLSAELFQTDFRPVSLTQRLKVGDALLDPDDLREVRKLKRPRNIAAREDPEHVAQLCAETIKERGQVLVFCWSKAATEACAALLAKMLGKILTEASTFAARRHLMHALEGCPGGLNPRLKVAIQGGVAFHHAGLTGEERKMIEGGFRRGVLFVLASTSTLSTGVNLPARRVIIRGARLGPRSFLTSIVYRQMSGRAGRAGLDTAGESILLAEQPTQKKALQALMTAALSPLSSCLIQSKRGFTRALLEVIAGRCVRSRADIEDVVRGTLCYRQDPGQALEATEHALQFLEQQQCIERKGGTSDFAFVPTKLGLAIFFSGFDPELGCILMEQLRRARERFMMGPCPLHLIYTVTPLLPNITVKWNAFNRIYTSFTPDQRQIADVVGIQEQYIFERSSGRVTSTFVMAACAQPNENQLVALVHTRFYAALALLHLVREVPPHTVAKTFEIPTGQLQVLQDTASLIAHMVSGFCKQLRWDHIATLASSIAPQLESGVDKDLLPLLELGPAMTGTLARALHKEEISTVLRVASASIAKLESVVRLAEPFGSEQGGGRGAFEFRRDAHLLSTAAKDLVRKRSQRLQANASHSCQSNGECLEYGASGSEGTSSSEDEDKDEAHSFEPRVPAYVQEGTEQPKVRWKCVHCSAAREFFATWSSRTRCAISLVFRPPPLLNDAARWNFHHPAFRTSSGRQQAAEVLCGIAVAWEDASAWLLPLPPRRPPVATFTAQAALDAADTQTSSRDANGTSAKRTCQAHQVAPSTPARLPTNAVAAIVAFVGVSCLRRKDTTSLCNSAPWVSRTWAHYCIAEYNQDWDELVAPRWRAVEVALSFPMQLEAFEMTSVLPALSRYGVTVTAALVDPRVAHWLLDPDDKKPAASLDALHEFHFHDNRSRFAGAASSSIAEIGCREALIVRRVAGYLVGRLSEEVLDESFHDVDMPLTASIAEMQTWGIGVQTSYLSTLRHLVADQVRTLVDQAAGFECELKCGNNNDALEDAIYTNLKLKAPPGYWKDRKGKTNKRPVKSEALQMMEKQHPLPGIVVRWRGLVSLLNNSLASGKFFKESRHMPVFDMRRCLPDVDPLTATGRMYFTSPNLQGVPKASTCAAAERSSLQHELDREPGLQIDLACPNSTAVWLLPSKCTDDDGRFYPHAGHIVEISSKPIAEPLPTDELGGKPLAQYWRERGVDYSEGDAARVRQVRVVTGWNQLAEQGSSANIVYYPADQVFRRGLVPAVAPASGAQSRWPQSFVVCIRNAFHACRTCTFITADYSQVEVRIMAHFSKEPTMVRLLCEGQDVFRGIAATWLKCKPEVVTSEQRNDAKQVCYSILYGQGARSLSNQLNGASSETASGMIRSFYAAFPELKKFTDSVVAQCRKVGYIETICGRRRFLPDIKSQDGSKRGAAERQAVNTLCQGSAADLIKCAMISIRERLLRDFPPAPIDHALVGQVDLTPIPPVRLVLQVHDELMFEVPDRDPVALQAVVAAIRTEMEAAFQLRVPLKVHMQQGPRWGSMVDL